MFSELGPSLLFVMTKAVAGFTMSPQVWQDWVKLAFVFCHLKMAP